MKRLKIFVEGKNDGYDCQIIKHIVQKIDPSQYGIDIKIQEVGGYQELFSEAITTKIKGDSFGGMKHIAILDADSDINERKKYLDEKILTDDLDLPYFLIPNNSESGNIETLILNIINSTEKDFFDCFDSYCICLNKCNNILKHPGDKEKVYAFLHSKTDYKKSRKIDLNDTTIWDIQHQDFLKIYNFIADTLKALSSFP
jgi:hypothetical protein